MQIERTFGMMMVCAASISMAAASHAGAALYTDGYQNPGFTGPTATYQEWQGGFTKTGFTAAGPNLPTHVSNPNPGTTNAGSPVGFVTSTNGIYHFNAKIAPTVVVPNYNLGDGYATTIVWQVSVDRIGEWLDLNTVTITPAGGTPIGLATGIAYMDKYYDETTSTWVYPTAYTTSTGTGSYTDLGLFTGIAAGYGEGPDYTKGYLFQWTLPGNASSYTLNALARGSSSSFKGTRVDTIASVIPSPGAMSVLSAAGLVALRRRRSAMSGRNAS